MASIRTIEQLISELSVITSQMGHAKALLSSARRKRDQMVMDGDAVAVIETSVNAILASAKDITDRLATELAALNYTFVPAITANPESGAKYFTVDHDNTANKGHIYATGLFGISGASGPKPFAVLDVSDKIKIEGSTNSDVNGYWYVQSLVNNGNGITVNSFGDDDMVGVSADATEQKLVITLVSRQ